MLCLSECHIFSDDPIYLPLVDATPRRTKFEFNCAVPVPSLPHQFFIAWNWNVYQCITLSCIVETREALQYPKLYTAHLIYILSCLAIPLCSAPSLHLLPSRLSAPFSGSPPSAGCSSLSSHWKPWSQLFFPSHRTGGKWQRQNTSNTLFLPHQNPATLCVSRHCRSPNKVQLPLAITLKGFLEKASSDSRIVRCWIDKHIHQDFWQTQLVLPSMDEHEQRQRAGKKPSRRRSRHNPSTSGRHAENANSDEGEDKPLKHSIPFLLNQAHNPAGSTETERIGGGSHHASASSTQRASSSSQAKKEPIQTDNAPSHVARYEDIYIDKKPRRRGDPEFATRSSSDRKRRPCETCGKTFAQPADLKKQYVTY